MNKLNEWGPMTVLMILLVVIVAGVGGAVVIINPDALSFEDYLEQIKTLALAVAGLGVGRGILAGAKHNAEAKVQATALSSTTEPPRVDTEVLDDLDGEDALTDRLDDEDLPEPIGVQPSGEREP